MVIRHNTNTTFINGYRSWVSIIDGDVFICPDDSTILMEVFDNPFREVNEKAKNS